MSSFTDTENWVVTSYLGDSVQIFAIKHSINLHNICIMFSNKYPLSSKLLDHLQNYLTKSLGLVILEAILKYRSTY